MLTSVKSCLDKNKKISEAIQKAKELDGTEEGKQAVELIREKTKPEPQKCEVCKKELKLSFDEKELHWYFHRCHKCEEEREKKINQELIVRAKGFIEKNIITVLQKRGVPKRYLSALLSEEEKVFLKNMGGMMKAILLKIWKWH